MKLLYPPSDFEGKKMTSILTGDTILSKYRVELSWRIKLKILKRT